MPYENAYFFYGHAAMGLNRVRVPPGVCVVSITNPGQFSRNGQMAAFHQLCKLANQPGGREYSKCLADPVTHKVELEGYLNQLSPTLPISLHISVGDFGQDTSDFLGFPLNIQISGSTYGIDKSGLHSFQTAGEGTFKGTTGHPFTEVQPMAVAEAFNGSITPTDGEVYTIALQNPGSIFDVNTAIETNHTLSLPRIFRSLQGRYIFYNLACRSPDRGISREAFGLVQEAARSFSSQHAQQISLLQGPAGASVNYYTRILQSQSRANDRRPAVPGEEETATSMGLTLLQFREWTRRLNAGENHEVVYPEIIRRRGGSRRRKSTRRRSSRRNKTN